MQTADSIKAEGMSRFQQGDHQQALSLFETAVSAYETAQDLAGQGEMLNNIGVLQRMQGNRQAAELALREAMTIFERLGDADRQGQAVGNLADVFAQKRKTREEAARLYSEAAALFATVQAHDKQSAVVRQLSLLRLRQGKMMEAMLFMAQSLELLPRPTVGQRLLKRMIQFAVSLMGTAPM